MRTFALVSALMLVQGCATEAHVIAITGESLIALDNTFVAVATAMKNGCDSTAIAAPTCSSWETFGRKYQQAEPLARDLWKVADRNQDAKLQKQVAAVIVQFASELDAFGALVGVK